MCWMLFMGHNDPVYYWRYFEVLSICTMYFKTQKHNYSTKKNLQSILQYLHVFRVMRCVVGATVVKRPPGRRAVNLMTPSPMLMLVRWRLLLLCGRQRVAVLHGVIIIMGVRLLGRTTTPLQRGKVFLLLEVQRQYWHNGSGSAALLRRRRACRHRTWRAAPVWTFRERSILHTG